MKLRLMRHRSIPNLDKRGLLLLHKTICLKAFATVYSPGAVLQPYACSGPMFFMLFQHMLLIDKIVRRLITDDVEDNKQL